MRLLANNGGKLPVFGQEYRGIGDVELVCLVGITRFKDLFSTISFDVNIYQIEKKVASICMLTEPFGKPQPIMWRETVIASSDTLKSLCARQFSLGFPVESIISKNFSLYAWLSDHATKDIIAPATFPDSPLSLLLL